MWMFRAGTLCGLHGKREKRSIISALIALWLSCTLVELLVAEREIFGALQWLQHTRAHGTLAVAVGNSLSSALSGASESQVRRTPVERAPTTKLNFWENSWLHTGNQSEGGGLLFSKIINSGLYLPG